MKFKKSLRTALTNEVEGVQDSYGGGYTSFEADGPPTVEISAKKLGKWLWVSSQADYEGRTWDPSTDRVSGDPYSAHTYHDWIGEVKSAPKTVAHTEELYDWALLHVGYERQYTDVGSWGVHSGRWVDDVTPEGIVKLRVESKRTFQDVAPVSETTAQQVDMSLFEDKSFNALFELLKMENPFTREIAAKLIGKLRDRRAVPQLIQLLDDEVVYVQEMAIKSLGMIGGEKAIQKLTTMLAESKYSPRQSMTSALREIGEPALEALVPAIHSENETVGIATVWIIEAIGGKKAIKILQESLDIEEPKVRSHIIYALGKLGGVGAIDSFIKNLKSDDIDVQRSAIQALDDLGDRRAIEPLVDSLIANHAWVREDAAKALDHFGWKPSTPEETVHYLFATSEWEKLIKMEDAAVETILKALSDPDEYHRGIILNPLAKSNIRFTDKRMADSIIAIYTDIEQEDYRRKEAIRALKCIPNPSTVKFLLKEYLQDESSYIRSGIFDTIEDLVVSGLEMGDELVALLKRRKLEKLTDIALEYYIALFKLIPTSLRNLRSIDSLLQSISKREVNDETKKIISNLLKLEELLPEFSSDASVRKNVISIIGDFKLPVELDMLMEALGDAHYKIRDDAAIAIGNLGKIALAKTIDALTSKNYRIRMGAAVALGRTSETHATKPLLKALRDKHPIVRQNAAWALGKMRLARKEFRRLTGQVIKALTKAMRSDEYLPVRYNAVYSLADTYDGRVVEPLFKAFDNPIMEFRLNATYGFIKLAQIYREPSDTQGQVIDKLIIALSDDVDRIRYNAADGLRLFGGEKALSALKSMVDDDDAEMRKLVKSGIEEIERMKDQRRSSWSYSRRARYELREPEAIEELIQELGDDDEAVQMDAQIALGQFGQLAFDRLMEVLQDKNEYWLIREGAAAALGRIRDKRAVDVLIESLNDDNEKIRCNVAWALAELKDKRSLKALIKATKDEFWMVRANAAAGVGKIGGRAALERLLRMVEDEHPTVREIVTSYIAQFKSPRVLPALKERLKDDDPEVSKIAKQWIGKLENQDKR